MTDATCTALADSVLSSLVVAPRRVYVRSHHELTTKVQQLNTSQLAFRRKQLDAEAAELDGLINRAIETKSYDGLNDIQSRLDKLAEEKELLDSQEAAHKAVASDPRYAAIAASGGDIAETPVKVKEVKRPLGREACPLAFTEESLKQVHQAMQESKALDFERGLDAILAGKPDPGETDPDAHNKAVALRLRLKSICK
jgi:hypothetical protein